MRRILLSGLIVGATSLARCQTFPVVESLISSAFAGHQGTFVLIDCASGAVSTFRPQVAVERLPPCSTFKIWNTLIGLNTGILTSADEAFYQWDGEERSYSAWNQNLTLKEAFQMSCVPAFQNLARQIGSDRMQSWVNMIDYGDRDISAGVDVFWLPAKARKTILVSPAEQAQLMYKLVAGKLSFSKTSLFVLKDLMRIKETKNGILYGKTGSGSNDCGVFVLGWFVGYVVSDGNTYAFACTVQGDNVMSKDARTIVETIFEEQGLL